MFAAVIEGTDGPELVALNPDDVTDLTGAELEVEGEAASLVTGPHHRVYFIGGESAELLAGIGPGPRLEYLPDGT
jgi:hypothetical protein